VSRLSTQGVAQALVAAGALTQHQLNQISRIVVDLPSNGLPQIYVQMDAPDESVWDQIVPELAPMLRTVVTE